MRFGAVAERLFDALQEEDPLADEAVAALDGRPPEVLDAALRGDLVEAPNALRRLVDACAVLPAWLDAERAEAAGRLLFRSGPAGGITLGAKSLIAGYCSPGGNKPLAFSGQLEAQVSRRLAETGRFVALTCTRGALRPFAEGWRVTLRVRLMHARIRRLLWRSGRWSREAWGAPINQHDMVATSLLFSVVFLDGVRSFGVPVDRQEGDGFVHLWRWSGWLTGAREELLPRDEAEGGRLMELIALTQGPPDEDSRRLANALLESPRGAPGQFDRLTEWHVALGQGFCRALLGESLADQLGLPRTRWRHVVPAIRTVLTVGHRLTPEPVRRRLAERSVARGERYWERNVELGLAGAAPRFDLPVALRR